MSIRMSNSAAALAAVLAIGSIQPLSAQQPQLHPNRLKYSDAGARPVTGRSGSATLQARALLGSDGVAHVDASTGDLDAPTAPGTIRKMQMKILSPTGKPTATQNFEGRGSRWSVDVPQLGENARLQLQANVSGIDGNRTDVVTVVVPVKRVPDVSVDGVAAPSRALAGFPVNVVATVSEKNGDVGAHASCMLQIDGTLADQARNIWIGAGHTVSCAFQTTVSTLGSHKVTVYVTGISPNDDTPSDNSASTQMEVLSPETPLAYSATFTSTDANDYTHFKSSLADGSYLDETTSSGTRLERTLSVTATTTNAFSFPVNVRSALVADGASVFDFTNDMVITAGASTSNADCGRVLNGRFMLSVCNMRSGAQRGQVNMASFDGRVTYLGSRVTQVDGDDAYITNTSSDTPTGNFGGYAVTSTVQPLIELRDASGMLFAARPMIALQSTPINSVSGSCQTNPFTELTQCFDSKSTGWTRSGTASSSSAVVMQ
jgi:hypothetical protein